MELLFIRHAQPEWERDGISLTDPPLTELGRTQAAHLAESARAWPKLDGIFVSSMRRARETAEPLCSVLGIEPVVVPWFQEIKLPASWEGAPAEVVGEWFVTSRNRPPDEWWEGVPGGESFDAFWTRITTNLEAKLEELGAHRPEPELHPSLWNVSQPEKRYAFVGHGGSNSAAISFLLGIEPVPWPWERFVSHHASVSRLKSSSLLGGRIFGLRTMSDTHHIPAESRTR